MKAVQDTIAHCRCTWTPSILLGVDMGYFNQRVSKAKEPLGAILAIPSPNTEINRLSVCKRKVIKAEES
jgi:hypothetical protein